MSNMSSAPEESCAEKGNHNPVSYPAHETCTPNISGIPDTGPGTPLATPSNLRCLGTQVWTYGADICMTLTDWDQDHYVSFFCS